MALTDEHWAKVMKAVALKMQELDLGKHELSAVLAIFKDNWELLSAEASIDTYINDQELAVLQAARDQMASDLTDLDAEIATKTT